MKRKKKIIVLLLLLLSVYTAWTQLYSFDSIKAAKYVSGHAESRSHCYCAWYVMRAMQAGGCPIGILPAWAYSHVLPLYGFREVRVSGYAAQRGDIVVIENSREHFWGHIAMYNGTNWVSDFSQRNMNPYRRTYPYRIFRHI